MTFTYPSHTTKGCVPLSSDVKVVTYILDTESGVSLKAAGYVCEGRARGLEWNGERKPKMANQYPYQMKTRWVKKIEKEGMNGR